MGLTPFSLWRNHMKVIYELNDSHIEQLHRLYQNEW